MTIQTIHRDAVSYTRATTRQALIHEAIGCIITGRPFPTHLAPPVDDTGDRPATSCEQGIGRILAGPAVVQTA
jgi:hypothetical protein